MPSISEIAEPAPRSAVERARDAKDKGNDHFKRKEWAEAVGCYSQAHVLDPKSPIYPLNRAQAYLNLQKFADAERDCTRSIELDGKNSKAWFRRAVARRELRDYEAAARDLFQVVKLDNKQEAPVKAEMEKLRKEQAEHVARKGKGSQTLKQAAQSAPKAIPIPIKMVYPASTRPPAPAPPSPPASAQVPAFDPASSSPLPEVVAVPTSAPSHLSLPKPSSSPTPPAPAPVFEPASSARLGEALAVPAPPPLPTTDEEGLEEAPRGLLSTPKAESDPARSIFGSLASPRPASTSNGGPSSSAPSLPTAVPPAPRPAALPSSAYALQTALSRLPSSARLPLLLSFPSSGPSSLPAVVGSSLEPPLVELLLSALGEGTAPGHAEKERLVQTLEGCRRWGMVLMMTPRGRERWEAFKSRP